MVKRYIPVSRVEGTASRQAHCDLPAGTYEREMSKEGFFGPAAFFHHRHPPTGWSDFTGPLQPRAFDLARLDAPAASPWSATEVLAKVDEECAELKGALGEGRASAVEEEFGDLLFSLAQFARHAGIDPEAALRAANAKFERRFQRMEAWLAEQGRSPRDATPDELETLWAKAKQELG